MSKKSEIEATRAKIQAELGCKPLLRVNYAALKKDDIAHSDNATFFFRSGWYRDEPFHCVDCGKLEIWKDTQQKWWYEVAKGGVLTTATRCRTCRTIQREKQATHLAKTQTGREKKKNDILKVSVRSPR
jgi:Probable zinc-ribbon domain